MSFYRRLKRDKMALFGGGIFIVIFFMAVSAPVIAPHNPYKMYRGYEYIPPGNNGFLLGTDALGRDMLSRVIWGARTSLVVGLLSVSVLTAIGAVLGTISGYYGGIVDEIVMRFTDLMMVFPGLPLLIIIAAIFRSRNIYMVILMIGIVYWPRMARVVRSKVLSVKEETYVQAARALGIGDLRIVLRHILPNSLSPIIVFAGRMIATAILIEASLSFLGLGDPLIVSWGRMIAEGREVLRSAWWVAMFPGIATFFIVLGLNLLGEGLRDALDVRMA